jgi:hypothetical protein
MGFDKAELLAVWVRQGLAVRYMDTARLSCSHHVSSIFRLLSGYVKSNREKITISF